MGIFHLPEELPQDLEKPIFATWFNYRHNEHGVRVISNSTELEVLKESERKGLVEIYTLAELNCGGNE